MVRVRAKVRLGAPGLSDERRPRPGLNSGPCISPPSEPPTSTRRVGRLVGARAPLVSGRQNCARARAVRVRVRVRARVRVGVGVGVGVTLRARVRLGLGTLPNLNPSPSPNLYEGEGGHFRARSPSPILNRKANLHALTCTKASAATQPRLKRAKVSCGESTWLGLG